MLVRFTLENLFSFGERKEFHMIPNGKLKTLQHHKYVHDGFELLKMTSLYGANGAGKSNLIKALDLLRRMVLGEQIPLKLRNSHFKLQEKPEGCSQLLAVEFIENGNPYYYALQVLDGVVTVEELYESGLGKGKDQLVYERKTDPITRKSTLVFSEEHEKDERVQLLKSILLEDFLQPNEPVLKLLHNRGPITQSKVAYNWFSNTLRILTPTSPVPAIIRRMETDESFKSYAEKVMCSLNVGVVSMASEKKQIREFFGLDEEPMIDSLIQEVENSPTHMMSLRNQRGDQILVVKEGEDYFVKQLRLRHQGTNGIEAAFELDDESDGTIRLLEFVPIFFDLVSRPKVYLIDEVERSIHPLLIKELVSKFSADPDTQGQLIFTTHETNLLDQDMFRQDEIWFAEKDRSGSTDLYSLDDYREHKTIDIRKGYMNGRYGSIPFLGNLRDLNWHEDAAVEPIL